MKAANRSSLSDEILDLRAWRVLRGGLPQAFEELAGWIGVRGTNQEDGMHLKSVGDPAVGDQA
jgi:hypothetical protein